MSDSFEPRELWRHPNPASTAMDQFRRTINQRRGKNLKNFHELYEYSVTELSNFWEDTWDVCNIIHEGQYTSIVDENARIDSVPDWFPGVRVSWAENVLFSRGATPSSRSKLHKEDHKIAVTAVREGDTETTHYTWGELRSRVGLYAQALRANGVKKGDRIAGVVSNSIDTMTVFIATVAIGAIWSSSSTDMGVKGVLDRLVQIEPTWLFMDDVAVYNGKTTDLRPNMKKLVAGMEGVKNFKGLVALPRFLKPADLSSVPMSQTLAQFLKAAKSNELIFERVKFREPFSIVYSSGTTGTPKCIVHCSGGVLLNSKKEHLLHHRVDENSHFLQYTTTGWIMYYPTVNCLLEGAHSIIYDGSPFYPTPEAFINLISKHKVTHLGLSPRYFAELQLRKISPRQVTDCSSLQVVTTTGMVLSNALSEWFYDEAYPAHVQLANMTGGTDTAAAFACGNPVTPVVVGECQNMDLGMKVEVFEQVDETGVKGTPVPDGTPGELVCTKVFPTMPVCFWGEGGDKKYFDSYFAKFDNVWTHGDFVAINPKTKGLIMMGRADGVLNPSGIRFGSSEIYSIIDRDFPMQIQDSICVGQRRPHDSDESVMLFLLMKAGVPFTQALVRQVKDSIAKGLSKRHVPKYVFQTPEIPTTINFKKVELPVKQIVSGKRIKPSGTLANPESLDFYYQFVDAEGMAAKAKL
ncbi:hypothetical protein RUND412_002125 [Rhizina undulata]